MIEKIKSFKELTNFLWKRKLWWLVPMVVILLVFGILTLVLGASPLAPIFYPLI